MNVTAAVGNTSSAQLLKSPFSTALHVRLNMESGCAKTAPKKWPSRTWSALSAGRLELSPRRPMFKTSLPPIRDLQVSAPIHSPHHLWIFPRACIEPHWMCYATDVSHVVLEGFFYQNYNFFEEFSMSSKIFSLDENLVLSFDIFCCFKKLLFKQNIKQICKI